MALSGVEKLIAKAIHDYSLINESDRILIGASGGKDSAVLAWALSRRRKWNAGNFELRGVHISGDVPGGGVHGPALEALVSLYKTLDIPLEIVSIPIIGRLKPGKSMNCYWCATQRRGELISYTLSKGFNKIALGHHLDDILTTLLMNMVKKGETATMVPRMKYRKYPVEIIRPLALVQEESIRSFAGSMGWTAHTCTCDYGADRERKEFQRRMHCLCGNTEEGKRNLFRAMTNIREEYLPFP
ncbi:tRNA 2-thiocytidine biosynthesis TtcA family protein [Breznakiella homolactica]|uniref:tRNA 2-thiocytidine biosynthesis protein TtcA n=1 Tax=Breznakiella homolactica TaxID=2798577 RepID=A0A7T7XJQ0_9SPIR|nr:tRNA 2-thiocytidine biosynthesis TtcA family protein [Breznakiella homolactica]QQO07423.1 tRNA 2-thiocytidine biosynthesis TtcA family protein [Breznakiella homolactica]